jgi:hypothetical protein
MNYRHLALRCHCGEVPEFIAEIGFTADHELVIHWWCPGCQRIRHLTKALASCWQECPGSDTDLEQALERLEEVQKASDREFLRSIGVRE